MSTAGLVVPVVVEHGARARGGALASLGLPATSPRRAPSAPIRAGEQAHPGGGFPFHSFPIPAGRPMALSVLDLPPDLDLDLPYEHFLVWTWWRADVRRTD